MKNDELVQAYLSLEALFLLVRSVIQRYQTSPFFSLLQRVVLQVPEVPKGGLNLARGGRDLPGMVGAAGEGVVVVAAIVDALAPQDPVVERVVLGDRGGGPGRATRRTPGPWGREDGRGSLGRWSRR